MPLCRTCETEENCCGIAEVGRIETRRDMPLLDIAFVTWG
jgi:hypothetical protein